MTWEQAFLLEGVMAVVLAVYYIFRLLGSIIPDRVKSLGMTWRKLKPGNTYITKIPGDFSILFYNITWALTPLKWYGRKMTESRSRQGFW
jgi:hypothetical protein